ncbi:MAG: hydroxyacid dehydrogenase [Candidatus Eisenbacteria bacterium]
MNRVLLLDSVSSLLSRLLSDGGVECVDLSKAGEAERDAALSGAQGVVVRSRTRITSAMIDRAPNLKVIGRAGAGTDTIDVAHARERGIKVLAIGGGNDVAVAELTLGLMLALARHVVPAANYSRAGEWAKSKLEGFELAGETLGVLGLGKIGGKVAQLGQAFGMEVIGHDPYVDPEHWERRGVRMGPIEQILPAARFVTLHLPLSDETKSLIGAAELGRMRKDAYLINCARGALIDDEALLTALNEGRLAGAALDVFRNEPELPKRLVEHPRVLATPHIGGSTQQAQEKIAANLAQQLVRFFQGDA